MLTKTLRMVALTAAEIVPDLECVAVRKNGSSLQVILFRVLTTPERHPDPDEQTFEAQCLMINGKPYSGSDPCDTISLSDIGCPRKGSPKGIQCRTFALDRSQHGMLVYDVLLRSTREAPHEYVKLFAAKEAMVVWQKQRISAAQPDIGRLPPSLSGLPRSSATLGLSVLAGARLR